MPDENDVLGDLVEAAHKLASNVKRNIKKDSIIDAATILSLNEYITAANKAADLLALMESVDYDKKHTTH